MQVILPSTLNEQFTHRGNLRSTRFGWLRLTPAYSVHLVSDLADHRFSRILDPFCGTGTTALVCAERGIPCDTTDINPFLVWLAKAKTAAYKDDEVRAFLDASVRVADAIRTSSGHQAWVPPLHQIEKWWDAR